MLKYVVYLILIIIFLIFVIIRLLHLIKRETVGEIVIYDSENEEPYMFLKLSNKDKIFKNGYAYLKVNYIKRD